MRILVDTCVWSLALRRSKSANLNAEERKSLQVLTEGIQNGRVVMIGPIRQELLSGIRDHVQFTKLRNALKAYPDEPIDTVEYESAAIVYNECRNRGLTGGPVDVLICAIAARRQWDVLTRDSELTRCFQIAKTVASKLS